jgi:GNAT superfamily N-acetyltransferase
MVNDVTVQAATVADARGIARVLVDAWQTTYAGLMPAEFLASFDYDQHEAGTRQHLENLPASAAVFVAVNESGGVVGVAHVRESNTGLRDFSDELDAIYVSPSVQRRNVGRRLLQAVVRWLQDRGHRSMFLWVLRDNPYRQFYERLGGELMSEQRRDEFGGASVVSVAYGWRDLDALAARLGEQLESRTT